MVFGGYDSHSFAFCCIIATLLLLPTVLAGTLYNLTLSRSSSLIDDECEVHAWSGQAMSQLTLKTLPIAQRRLTQAVGVDQDTFKRLDGTSQEPDGSSSYMTEAPADRTA